MHLNLAHTGITAKGVGKLAEALHSNKFVPTSLKLLDLTENSLKGDETSVSCGETPSLYHDECFNVSLRNYIVNFMLHTSCHVYIWLE